MPLLRAERMLACPELFSLFGIFFSGEDEEEPCGFNAYGAFATPSPPHPQSHNPSVTWARLAGLTDGKGGAPVA